MRVVDKMVTKMVDHNVIKESDGNIYGYGLTVLILKAASLAVAVLISVLIRATINLLVFLIFFVPLRKYAGGFHEKTALRCFIGSQIILIIVELIMKYATNNLAEYIIGCVGMAIGMVIIVVKSPVDSVNRKLNAKQKNQYRKISLIICVILILTAIFFVFIDMKIITFAIFITFITEGILLLVPEKKES